MNLRTYKLIIDSLRDSLKSGLTFYSALSNLAQMRGLPHSLRLALKEAAEKIANGKPIDEALASSNLNFPPTLKLLLRAGAVSGRLLEVLEEESEEVEKLIKLRTAFMLGMLYPTLLFFVLACAINGFYYILRFMISRFSCSGIKLSGTLALLKGVIDLGPWLPLVIGVVIVLVWLLFVWYLMNNLVGLRLKLTGMFRGISIGRLLKLLGLMVGSGLTLDYSLSVIRKEFGLKGVNGFEDLLRMISNRPEYVMISNSMVTGTIDKGLKVAGEKMIEDGFRKVKLSIFIATTGLSLLAMLILAALIISLYVGVISSIYKIIG